MPVHCRATHTDTIAPVKIVELLSQSSGVSLRRHVEARRADKERYNKTVGDKRQQVHMEEMWDERSPLETAVVSRLEKPSHKSEFSLLFDS